MAHDPSVKAAVIAALLSGQSVGDVAAEYNVPRQTVSYWNDKTRQENWHKKDEIGDLLIGYLAINLETLQKQAKVFGDESWLKRQDASSVAVLHGVMVDKVFRLLEALSKNASSD